MFGLRNGSERKQEFTGVPGGLPEPPGDIMGLMGLSGKGGKGWLGRPRASPPFPSPSRTRRRGRRPSPSLSPSGNLVGLGLGGGNPTPGGSRTPLARQAWPASPLPLLLYIRGQGGTPRHTS